MAMSTSRRVLASVILGAGIVCALHAQSTRPVTIVAYGDTRFTNPSNVTATSPAARAALIARIAEERPDAIVISGDLPWHGGVADDYAQFHVETGIWRAKQLRIIPALGNHEFSQCAPAVCLDNWWAAFPELFGKRWYAVDVGPRVRVIALDSASSLTAGSAQRTWLEREVDGLSADVDFLIIALHHPPVADIQTRLRVDHNPRPNEIALAEYLKRTATRTRARILVVAGHIHNYERQSQDDVMYLVSGGGGAVPYEVERTAADLYKGTEFPNYHYVKLTIADGRMTGEMFRLDEPAAPSPHFTMKDSFELNVRPAATR
jgi:acid phosphatase type 7